MVPARSPSPPAANLQPAYGSESHEPTSTEQVVVPARLPSPSLPISIATKPEDAVVSSTVKSVDDAGIGLSLSDEDVTTQRRHDTIRDSLRQLNTEADSSSISDITSIISPITTPAISDIITSIFSENAPGDDDASEHGDAFKNDDIPAVPEHRTSARICSMPKPLYQGDTKARSSTRSRRPAIVPRSKVYMNGEAPGIQCQCSTRLPAVFLQMLERDPEPVDPDIGSILAQTISDYKDNLCLQHSKRLTNWALATMPHVRKAAAAANIPSPPTHFSGTSRRRSSSVPDTMRDLPPTKKRRLAESTFLFTPVAKDRMKAQDQKGSQFPWANRGGARPSHDSIGDAEFRQHVLNQLRE